MKLYSNKGKYSSLKNKRKKSPLVKVLLAVLALVLVILLGLLVLLLRGTGAEDDFQDLSARVQERVRMTEAPTAETAAAATVLPGTTDPAETETTPQIPVETEPAEKTILPQYATLYQENSDLIGWIKIADTKLDYPVMHTPDDPEKYLHANFEGEYSYPGVPFLDAKCSADSDNLLIYGHNMPNGSMFRSLMKYQEKNYWQQHPVIQFDTLYESQEYEVLAAFYDRVYYKTETVFKFYQFIDAEDEADFDNAISQFKEKSLYDTGVEASYGDKLITLVTCAYHTDNGRFVVVARKK